MNVPASVATVVDHEFGSDVVGVEQLSGGCKETYRVELADRTVVVAFPRESWYERQFTLEPALMDLVGRETPVPVPQVLASDVSGTWTRPYHVTAAIDAPNLGKRFSDLSRETQVTLLAAAGRALAELHDRIRFEAHGPLGLDSVGTVTVDAQPSWPAFLAALVDRWLDELETGRFADLRSTFETTLTPESVLSCDPEPVCLHFDYGPHNHLADGDELAGVVDWGFAVAGHAEYDLFEFEKNVLLGALETDADRADLRPHVTAGYRAVRPLDPGWKRRRAFYRVAYKLASMRSFDRWSRGDRETLAARLRTELTADLERFHQSADG